MTEKELSHLQERIRNMSRLSWQKFSNPSLNSNAPAHQQLWKCSRCVVQMQLILSQHPANQSVWGTRMRLQEGIWFASGEQIKRLLTYQDITEFCSTGKALEKTDERGSQCQCISTHSKFIPPKNIQDVRISLRGPHCKNVEVMWALFLNSILLPTGGTDSAFLSLFSYVLLAEGCFPSKASGTSSIRNEALYPKERANSQPVLQAASRQYFKSLSAVILPMTNIREENQIPTTQGTVNNLDNEESIKDTNLILLTWIKTIPSDLACIWQSLKGPKLFPVSELHMKHLPVWGVGNLDYTSWGYKIKHTVSFI